MSARFLLSAMALILAVLAPICAAGGLLVLSDGSAIAVDEMTVRGGRVEVRLPGSEQPVAYAVGDVDLEASGLVPEQAPTTFETRQKQMRGGFESAIAAPSGDQDVVIITDQDVEHVRPPREGEDEGESEAAPAARVTRLLVSNLQREVSPGGPLTVTGTVTNSGTVSVSAIAITGDAQDRDGASVGRGTTGISSTLDAGDATAFTITIPVTGTVANVKVTAAAAVSEFAFEPIAAPRANADDVNDDYDEVSEEEELEEELEDEVDDYDEYDDEVEDYEVEVED